MRMLTKLLILASLSVAKEMEQVLVFGKDDGEHFCDFCLNPSEQVSEVTIFEVIDDENDQAIARVRLTPTNSPKSNGYSRIEIPDNLAVEGTNYSFQYTFSDGTHAFSEPWTYDVDRKQFALSSAVKKKFWRDPRVQLGAGIVGALAAVGGATVVYRKLKKSRNAL